MKEPIGFISPINILDHEICFKKAKVGDLIDYSLAYSIEEIKGKAGKFGLQLKHQPPGSLAYKRFGCNIMKVVKKIELIPKPLMFDPNMLVT